MKTKSKVKYVSRMRVVNDGYTDIFNYSTQGEVRQVESKDLTLIDTGNGWSIRMDDEVVLSLDYCQASALIHSAFFLERKDHNQGLQGLQGDRFKRIFTRVRKYPKTKKGAKR